MRELERDLPAPTTATPSAPAGLSYLAIVGAGRAGGSLARSAKAAGLDVETFGRDDVPSVRDPSASVVLLCVPDAEIATACERIAPALPPGTPVGHVSGATPLAALDPAARRGCPTLSAHPLQTIPTASTDLRGAPCAISGSSPDALALAKRLALALGLAPFELADDNRAAYHAAASLASNFLIALEESAARLLGAAGVEDPRAVLAPLVLRTAENWAERGGAALTGPIARGDQATVARHRDAIARQAPELTALFEALAERTSAVAAAGEART